MFTTLRTRVGGFPFVIMIDRLSGEAIGMFQGETSFMDLPYELRSTYAQKQGQTLPILIAADQAIRDYVSSLNFHSTFCEDNCERCVEFGAILDRIYGDNRGDSNTVALAFRKSHVGDDQKKRAYYAMRNCGICEVGPLMCDEHSLMIELSRI